MPTRKPPEHKVLAAKGLFYFLPAVVWGFVVLYFSLLPGPQVPKLFLHLDDKLVHGGIYFVSTALIFLGFIRYKFSNEIPRGSIAINIAVCLVFGAAIELLQHYWVSNRSGDWGDLVANGLGTVIGVLVLVVFHRWRA